MKNTYAASVIAVIIALFTFASSALAQDGSQSEQKPPSVSSVALATGFLAGMCNQMAAPLREQCRMNAEDMLVDSPSYTNATSKQRRNALMFFFGGSMMAETFTALRKKSERPTPQSTMPVPTSNQPVGMPTVNTMPVPKPNTNLRPIPSGGANIPLPTQSYSTTNRRMN